MRFFTAFASTMSLLALPALAHAGTATYDNTANQYISTGPFGPAPVYFPQNGDLALNEITVTEGGPLQSITFSAAHFEAGPSFPPITPDATVYLFLDDGDNDPDDDADGVADADQLLFQSSPITLPAIASAQSILHTIDTAGEGVVIPENATLWVGVQYANDGGRGAQALYENPVAGSTSARMWTGASGITTNADGVGVGFALTVPAPAALPFLTLGLASSPRRRRR